MSNFKMPKIKHIVLFILFSVISYLIIFVCLNSNEKLNKNLFKSNLTKSYEKIPDQALNDNPKRIDEEIDPFCQNKYYGNVTPANQIDPRILELTINPVDLCRASNIRLFVYIFSKVDNFEIRSSIRSSWASRQLFSDIRFAFILGLSNDMNVNRKLEKESKEYSDIIQGSFLVYIYINIHQ